MAGAAAAHRYDPQVGAFVPNESGEYTFACPMGMFRGKLIVE